MVKGTLYEMVCSMGSDICSLSMTDFESCVLMSATELPIMNENILILLMMNSILDAFPVKRK